MKFVFLLLLFTQENQLALFIYRDKPTCLQAFNDKTKQDYHASRGKRNGICTKIEVTK